MRDFVSIGIDGRFRSSKMERLAEIFEDYDPELEVQWIPPEYRTSERSPHYQLVHHSSKSGSYVIGTWWDTDDPEQVYARFILGDTRKHNVLNMIEAQEEAELTFRMKEWDEDMEERKDKVRMFFSDRNYFTMRDYRGDLVKYDEQRRRKVIK